MTDNIRTGLPLFTDNFDTEMTFAENWIAEKDAVPGNQCIRLGGGSVTLYKELPQEFVLSFGLTLQTGKRFTVNICNVSAKIGDNKLTLGNESVRLGDGILTEFTVRAACPAGGLPFPTATETSHSVGRCFPARFLYSEGDMPASLLKRLLK